jgi:probable HAF family extracellular repeat protein
MKRTTIISSLMLATLASSGSFAHAQYTAHNLGAFAAHGINDAGTIVGTSVFRPASYNNGVINHFWAPPPYSSGGGSAYAINNAGTIVGYTWTGGGGNVAFSYSGGVTTDLSLRACLKSEISG